jgi:hypothetical protein
MSRKGLSFTTKATILSHIASTQPSNSRYSSSRGPSYASKHFLLAQLDGISHKILDDMHDIENRKKGDKEKAINNYKIRFRVMAKQKGIDKAVTEAFLDNLEFKYSNTRATPGYFLTALRTDKTIPEINKHLSMFSRIGGKKSKTIKKGRDTKKRKTISNRK